MKSTVENRTPNSFALFSYSSVTHTVHTPHRIENIPSVFFHFRHFEDLSPEECILAVWSTTVALLVCVVKNNTAPTVVKVGDLREC